MKKCFKCNKDYPLDNFYKHPEMSDGHLNKCKECTMKDSNLRYELKKTDRAWMEAERKRGRIKYDKYKYKSSHSENPDKRKAKSLTSHIRGKDGCKGLS